MLPVWFINFQCVLVVAGQFVPKLIFSSLLVQLLFGFVHLTKQFTFLSCHIPAWPVQWVNVPCKHSTHDRVALCYDCKGLYCLLSNLPFDYDVKKGTAVARMVMIYILVQYNLLKLPLCRWVICITLEVVQQRCIGDHLFLTIVAEGTLSFDFFGWGCHGA
jgi:hypothetical protein